MQLLGFILVFGIGLVQMAAVFAGLQDWLGLNLILTIIGALIIGVIPVLGFMTGVGGAVVGWGWEWWQAALLFMWPMVGAVLLTGGEALFDSLRRR